ncbi:TetR family transcriptional regulator [Streptomyces qinglanensis]|uniref:TetR family transcriptional regulator n=1 Tax=Streptomyces qinglanensis TaxID=943816 RepID=A0A1E7KAI3_9ACTN|nr:TetR family transcriptional regulator [Streptomyces qinglanensis]OEV00874.1 TetR family transcriptional regulator [Streptomyces qinglanensis]
MAWDTARTKQRLLDAAVEEFAACGPEGARIARIAARAEINKERIYQYFGSKEQLFVAVLRSELERVAAAVPLDGDQAADLGDYAGRLFDYHRDHPHLARLLAWEGLQYQDRVVSEAERTGRYREKAAALAEAQRAGALTTGAAPGALTHAVITLTASFFTLPQVARMLVPGDGGADGADDVGGTAGGDAAEGAADPDPYPGAAQRAALVAVVRLMAGQG